MLFPLLLAALLSTSPPAPGPEPAARRVFVFGFRAEGDVDETFVRALERDVAAAAARRRTVVSQQDITAMFDVEAARQAAGCDAFQAGASCLSELAGSFGADEVLTGTITAVAGETELHLVLLDSSGARVLARAQQKAPSSSPRLLREGVNSTVATLFGAPSGPHPALIGGGVAAVVGLGVVVVGLLPLGQALAANGQFNSAVAASDGSRAARADVFSAADERDEATTSWNQWGWLVSTIGAAGAVAGVTTAIVVPALGGE